MDAPTIDLYDAHAAEWAASRGGPADDMAERIRMQVGDGPILDAGCGVGRYLVGLRTPTVGLDASAGMLQRARACGTPLVRGDLERLPFAGQVFAGLYARHSYLHLEKDQVGGAFTEAARVLRRGGHLLVTLISGDYAGRALSGDDMPGRWFSLWHRDELVDALSGAGFTDIDVGAVETRRGHDLVARAARR